MNRNDKYLFIMLDLIKDKDRLVTIKVKDLSKLMSMGERTLIKAINRLNEKGFIKINKEHLPHIYGVSALIGSTLEFWKNEKDFINLVKVDTKVFKNLNIDKLDDDFYMSRIMSNEHRFVL